MNCDLMGAVHRAGGRPKASSEPRWVRCERRAPNPVTQHIITYYIPIVYVKLPMMNNRRFFIYARRKLNLHILFCRQDE